MDAHRICTDEAPATYPGRDHRGTMGHNIREWRLELSRTHPSFQMAGGLGPRPNLIILHCPAFGIEEQASSFKPQAGARRKTVSKPPSNSLLLPTGGGHIRPHGQPQPPVGHTGFVLETIGSRASFAIVTTGKTRTDKRPCDCRASGVTAHPAAGLARRDQATHGSRA